MKKEEKKYKERGGKVQFNCTMSQKMLLFIDKKCKEEGRTKTAMTVRAFKKLYPEYKE